MCGVGPCPGGHPDPSAVGSAPGPGWRMRPGRGGGTAARCQRPSPSRPNPRSPRRWVSEVIEAGSLPVRWVTCDEGYGCRYALPGSAGGPGAWATVPRCPIPPGSGPRGQQLGVPPAPVTGRSPYAVCGWPPGRPARRRCKDVAAPATRRRLATPAAERGQSGVPCAPTLRLCGWSLPGAPSPAPMSGCCCADQARTAQLKTYLIQGPADMTLAQLVWLAAMRWPIETCFQEGKQLLGPGGLRRTQLDRLGITT